MKPSKIKNRKQWTRGVCCRKCSFDKWRKQKSPGCKKGYSWKCAVCDDRRNYEWAKNNPDKKRETSRRWHNKNPVPRQKAGWRAKGLDADKAYDAYSTTSSCQICGVSLSTKTGKHVDHCHTTGRIRGVLCRLCNLGLGAFNDFKSVSFSKIAKYLGEKHV